MLVLSRMPEEAIVISGEVKIIVLSVRGKQVRLGIEAPRDVAVYREEIYQKIKSSSDDTASNVDGICASNTYD